MNLTRVMVTLLLTLVVAAPTVAAGTQSLLGSWSPLDRSAVISFRPCSARICGTVLEGKLGPSKSDMRGKVIMRDLAAQTNGDWVGRFVGDGHDMPVTLKLVGADRLDVKMCMMRFLCRTRHLIRMN